MKYAEYNQCFITFLLLHSILLSRQLLKQKLELCSLSFTCNNVGTSGLSQNCEASGNKFRPTVKCHNLGRLPGTVKGCAEPHLTLKTKNIPSCSEFSDVVENPHTNN